MEYIVSAGSAVSPLRSARRSFFPIAIDPRGLRWLFRSALPRSFGEYNLFIWVLLSFIPCRESAQPSRNKTHVEVGRTGQTSSH